MLKKVLQLLLIFLAIIFGGFFIAYFFYPQSDIPGQKASNFGEGIVYSGLIVIFLWAVYGSYKKWVIKKDLVEAVGTSKKRSLKIIIITAIIFTVLVIPALYLMLFSTGSVTTQTDKQSEGWTDENKASFKKGLLGNCGDKAIALCECTADYLIDRYSLDELSKIQNSYKEGDKPPQEFLDASHSCISSSR